MRLALFALIALAACQPDAGGAPGDAPVFTGDLPAADDGAEVAGFGAFRDSLRAVAARRDTAALLALVAPDALVSFGDAPGGPDGVRAVWFDAEPAEPVWAVLGRILDGGTVEQDGAVVAPAVAALWPDALAPASHVAVPGRDVAAFDAPGGDVVARLTEIVLPTAGPASGGWQPVTLPDGRSAVVAAAEVQSPVGHRATFWDDGDGWRVRSFVADD
ncbi:hypothetical protein [Rubrivirga sp.]|uniref:hypothetical protein n=1 Tax=Rubrivirga sp. TaxID=1885344 RepID=UPI003B51FD79